MPYKDLIALIGASNGGTPGVAGQRFSANVVGAGAGVKMTDYLISNWTFDGSQVPIPEDEPYGDGHIFSMPVLFTQGVKASLIKRTGAGRVQLTGWSGGPGSSGAITSSIVSADYGSNIAVTVTSPYSPGGSLQMNMGFTDGFTGSGDSAGHPVRFRFAVNGSGSGTSDIGWTLSYQPDDGNFNPPLVKVFSGVTVYNRPMQAEDYYESEFHANSSYTSYVSAFGYDFTSYPLTTMQLWHRYRQIGTSTWITSGAAAGLVSWTDPRDS